MFNSVARYLWGAADNEEENADQSQQDPLVKEIVNPDDTDWILVDAVDKENVNIHHHHYYHSHHPASNPLCHHPSPTHGATCEMELLDDADSLARHLATQPAKSSPDIKHENCFFNVEPGSSASDSEENGVDPSSFRPSSPESVFSACSGRSHATYRPNGQASEAWVVAPPPCFTGSQIDDSEPLASSPLENLLIEHPSMSVYHYLPSSDLSSPHPLLSLPAIADTMPEAGRLSPTEERTEVEDRVDSNNVQAVSQSVRPIRHRSTHAALHAIQLCPEKLAEKSRNAQCREICHKQKNISNQKCHRWNLVHECSSSSKRHNRRNKLMRPSGCKSSRNSQRVH